MQVLHTLIQTLMAESTMLGKSQEGAVSATCLAKGHLDNQLGNKTNGGCY